MTLIFGIFRETQKYPTLLMQKKTLLNQELNSLEDHYNSGKIKITRTGNGTFFKLQQEVSDLSSNEILSEHNLKKTAEVILVKNDGILPGADGFTPDNNYPKISRYGRPRMRRQNENQVANY